MSFDKKHVKENFAVFSEQASALYLCYLEPSLKML